MSLISDLRREYKMHNLSEDDISDDPIYQFEQWFLEAINADVSEPNAFTLATVDESGFPSARILLLKGVDQGDFIFYTNYESRKAKDMAHNPKVAMCFLWHELERQIRVLGHVAKVTREESEAYFHSRPKESQLGAWVSDQSKIITSRAVLDQKMDEVKLRFKDFDVIPLPKHWGGYRVKPIEIEFWQGRPNRLHDRISYLNVKGQWKKQRLSP